MSSLLGPSLLCLLRLLLLGEPCKPSDPILSGDGSPLLPPAISAAVPDPDDPWAGKFDASSTTLGGNSESATATVGFEAKYEPNGFRWIFAGGYAGIRQTDATTGSTSTQSRLYHGSVEHHRFFDEEADAYVYGKGAGRSDVPNGLEIRTDIGGGLGYTFRLGEEATLSFEGGAAWLREDNVGAEPGAAASGRAALRLDLPINEDLSMTSRGEFFSSFEDIADRSFTGEIGLRWMLNSTWFVQATASLAWDNTPGPGLGQSDTRYVIGIGTTF